MNRRLQIQYVALSPAMDGDASRAPWAQATWHGDFRPVVPSTQPSMSATFFAIVHDRERLYFAVKCLGGPNKTSDKLATDQVQILIDSECKEQRTGLFVCLPDGTVDARTVMADGGVGVWGGDVAYVSQSGSDGWTMTLAVPLSQLCHHGNLRKVRMNVVRVPYSNKQESWLSFAALSEGAFWKPQNVTVEAEFERPDYLSEYDISLKRAGRGQIQTRNGRRMLHQEVKLINSSSLSYDLELNAIFKRGGQPPCVYPQGCLHLESGQFLVHPIEVPVPEGRDFSWVQVMVQKKVGGRCVCESRFFVEDELLSWKEHFIKRADGKSGYTCRLAEAQFMPRYQGRRTCPYGLAQMDNGETILVGTAWPQSDGLEQTLVTISGDGGSTWGDYIAIQGIHTRPMELAYLGQGVVTFEAGDTTERFRLFSHDYGRTWTERLITPPAPNGLSLGFEGNPLVDRDAQGNAVRIAQIGQTLEGRSPHWKINEYIRWSEDGGRTWSRVSRPEAWRWTEKRDSNTRCYSGGEGSLVRAANGWIVAALRTFGPLQLLDHLFHEDSLEGTAVSISKDDGATWSSLQTIFEGGRHHPSLVRLPNGDLIMTVIRRVDLRDGKLGSYRRGCDAVISHDHGLTWDVAHLYVLDDFPFCAGENWVNGECGHQCATVLTDGSILTAYGNYLAGGVLIRWRSI
jgi:hypothetical protein